MARHFFPGISKGKGYNSALVADFSMIFRELFSVAADNLARRLRLPLSQLGVLFEELIGTGTMIRANGIEKLRHNRNLSSTLAVDDPERGIRHIEDFSKGQFLFVVRQLKKVDVDDMTAQGYRFAFLPHIADHLSRSIQIPNVDILKYLGRMQKYTTTESLMDPGIYVACFMIKPNLTKGFDVLVPANAQNQLPTVALPFTTMTPWQANMLHDFDNRKLSDVLKAFVPRENDESTGDKRIFKWHFHRAMSTLVQTIGDQAFVEEARFSATPVQAPCHSTPGTATYNSCPLLAFRLITSIHGCAPSDELTYVALRFFKAQQQVAAGLSGLHDFMLESRADFKRVHGRKSVLMAAQEVMTKHSRSSSKRTVAAPQNSPSSVGKTAGICSTTSLAVKPMEEQVKVHEMLSKGKSMELKEYDTDREERARVREPRTFVDELYKLFLT